MTTLGKILAFGLCAYLALALMIFLAQRRLLYPGAGQGGALTPAQAAAAGLRHWPSPGDFRGYLAEPPGPRPAAGTVVLFHGNGGTAWHRAFYAKALGRHGLRVVLAEYPGYGGRPGAPDEQSLLSDGRETARLARQAFDGPLYLWGESLGCGVAAGVAGQTGDDPSPAGIDADAVVMFLPWDSLAALARTHYWYLPTGWLLLDRYDSSARLADFAGPVAVLLAGRDRVIPPAHGRRLYDTLNGDKALWVFPEAGHGTVPVDPGRPWWGEVVTFVSAPGEKAPATGAPPTQRTLE